MYTLTLILGIVAAILNLVAYIAYNRQAKRGASIPNTASWIIWVFLATLNAWTYHEMSGDTILTLAFFVGSLCTISTFIYVFMIGKFSWPAWNEWILLTLGIFATLVWWAFRSAAAGNVILVVAFVLSCVPTLRGVLQEPSKEAPVPWRIWTASLLIGTVNVILRKGVTIDLLAPAVGLIAYGVIAFLAREKTVSPAMS